ncbi:MAG: HIT family protein [Syntrophobacteraceae bacterium]|jgi:histidine triad (HIT) family protein
MTHCIFCRIIRGEIPSMKVYEDELVFSFVDINPITPGHTLVVPKRHYATLFDMPQEDLHACSEAIRNIGQAIHKAMGAEGLNLLQNNFRAAGQLVDHAHFHLIPRFEGDGFLTSWQGQPTTPEELRRNMEKIAAEL